MLCGLTVLSTAGPRAWPWELVTHFQPQTAALSLALAAAALLARLPVHGLLAGLIAISPLATITAPSEIPVRLLRTADARGAAPYLSVVTHNVLASNPARAAVIAWLRTVRPDIAVIQESTSAWRHAFLQIADMLPYQAHGVSTHVDGGITVLSRHRLLAQDLLYPTGDHRKPLLSVTLDAPQGPVTLVAAHPWSPRSAARLDLRDRYLEAAAALIRKQATPTVLAGDLNATPWSPIFADLAGSAALSRADRSPATFPAFLGPFGIPIDHIAGANGAAVTRITAGPALGSDHRPLVASVQLP